MTDYAGKTLLIIGAGHEQVPAIQIAQSLGLKVVVTDLNPKAPGASIADVFGEISTADKEANLNFAKQQRVDGVMTLSSELAVPVVAYVCDALNLNSGLTEDIAYKATNKNAMHQVFEADGVSCPQAKKVLNLDEVKAFVAENGYPVVIKPSDSSGQKGLGIFHQGDDLQAALEDAIHYSTDGAAIIEEYIEGPEINVTAAVIGGRVSFLSFSHRVTAEKPHFGIAIAHQAPANISGALLDEVKQTALGAIKAIGLKNGIAYPQIIASESKGARILEIAARIPGGHMREVALLLSGVDMIEVAIDQALGLEKPFQSYQKYPQYPAVYVKFLTQLDYPDLTKVSQISGFAGRLEKAAEYLSECRLQVGQSIPDLTSSSARFASLICAAESVQVVEKRMQTIIDRVVIS